MAKVKPAAKKTVRPSRAKNKPAAKKSARKPVAPKRAVVAKSTPQAVAKSAPQKEAFTAEYREYLERYDLDGTGRPRLTPTEFDRLDEELLDLLALEAERGLSDEQVVRLQELEYLLLDSE